MTNTQPCTANAVPTLQVNSKELVLTYANGQWWVAVKPICEALGINYKAQHKAISDDKILSQLSSIQRTTGADGKRYEMLCLPEKFIYGWLFSINSDSEQLQLFKLECYEALYNHFHSSLYRRQQILKEKTLREKQIEALQQKLQQNPDVLQLQQLLAEKKQAGLTLQLLDKEFVSKQISLWETEAI